MTPSAVAGTLLADGARAVGRADHLYLGLSVGVLAATLSPPALALGRSSLAVHMMQYVLLTDAAAPLLMLGLGHKQPHALLSRDHVLAATALLGVLTTPEVAGGLDVAALVTLHIPRIYAQMTNSGVAYVLELALLLASALPLWWVIIHPAGVGAHGYLRVLGAMVATALPSSVFGLFLFIAAGRWYPTSLPLPWNLSPLLDQQLAGVILAFPCDVLDALAVAGVFLSWLRRQEQLNIALDQTAR